MLEKPKGHEEKPTHPEFKAKLPTAKEVMPLNILNKINEVMIFNKFWPTDKFKSQLKV